MRKLVSLLLVLALAFGAAGAMAESLLPYDGDPVVWKGYAADLGAVERPETEVVKDYRKDTGSGVSIEWTLAPVSDYGTTCALMLNTGDLTDIVWFSNPKTVIDTYGEMGYFLDFIPLFDYMPNFSVLYEESPQMKKMTTADGKLYALSGLSTIDSIAEAWHVNKTELEKLNLPVPTTWDEMLEAMRAFKAANPEGTPLVSYGWGYSYYQSFVSRINSAETDFYWNGEKWTHGLVDGTGGYKEVVEMMNTLHKEELLHPEYATMSDEQADQLMQDGNWLFACCYLNSIESEVFMGEDMPFVVEAFPTPDYSADKPGTQWITTPYDVTPFYGYMVNADVKNPELMASYLDNLYTEEGYYRANWGVQGVSYEIDEEGLPYYLDDYGTNAEKRAALGIGSVLDNFYVCRNLQYHEFVNFTKSGQENHQIICRAIVNDGKPLARYQQKPTFTAEQNDALSALVTPFNTYVNENILLFVDGTRSMDEWDAFVEEALAYTDMDAVLEIYESGVQNHLSEERRVPIY